MNKIKKDLFREAEIMTEKEKPLVKIISVGSKEESVKAMKDARNFVIKQLARKKKDNVC